MLRGAGCYVPDLVQGVELIIYLGIKNDKF